MPILSSQKPLIISGFTRLPRARVRRQHKRLHVRGGALQPAEAGPRRAGRRCAPRRRPRQRRGYERRWGHQGNLILLRNNYNLSC